jgi:hypothetical protein
VRPCLKKQKKEREKEEEEEEEEEKKEGGRRISCQYFTNLEVQDSNGEQLSS